MLPYLLGGVLLYFAFKQPGTAPQQQVAGALPASTRPPLDATMPAEVHRAVWNCYDRCQNPAQIDAFARDLEASGFRVGAALLRQKLGHVGAPAPAPKPQQPQEAQRFDPAAIKHAIEHLNPEQRRIFDSMVSGKPFEPEQKPAAPPTARNGAAQLPETSVATLMGDSESASARKVAIEAK